LLTVVLSFLLLLLLLLLAAAVEDEAPLFIFELVESVVLSFRAVSGGNHKQGVGGGGQ
jgi:hypothetical protein